MKITVYKRRVSSSELSLSVKILYPVIQPKCVLFSNYSRVKTIIWVKIKIYRFLSICIRPFLNFQPVKAVNTVYHIKKSLCKNDFCMKILIFAVECAIIKSVGSV